MPTYTLKEVRLAWLAFQQLGQPQSGSPGSHYRARDQAWREYCRIRDHFMYDMKALNLGELNRLYYPSLCTPFNVNQSMSNN